MYFHLRSWGSMCSSGRWEDAQEAAILFQGGDATPQQTLDWIGMQSERERSEENLGKAGFPRSSTYLHAIHLLWRA